MAETRNLPHALVARDTPDTLRCRAALGLDDRLNGKHLGVDEAIAFYVHSLAMPAVLAGTRVGGTFHQNSGQVVGGRLYEANHSLTIDFNLFTGITRIDSRNEAEPVIVSFALDGSARDTTQTTSGARRSAVVRCSVRAVTQALALECAWRLHTLFSRRPSFNHTAQDGCDQTPPRVSRLVLQVHRLDVEDEPRIVEREASREHAIFRVQALYSRVF